MVRAVGSQVPLDGRVAVVTGAARGLGRAYARALAGLGATIVVNDLPDAEGLDELVRELVAQGSSALAVRQTVATRAGGEAIVAAAIARFGRIDVLVNNAGILRPGYFADLTDEQIDEIVDVHLKGAFYVTQPAYRAMQAAGYGRIVNTSSSSAFGMLGLSNYAAAKAGLIGLTRALALESAERGHGILVNAVMPNARTRIGEHHPVPDLQADDHYMALYQALGDRMEPEFTAPLVAYLCTPACTVNGEIFTSLGGRYARAFFGVTGGWLSTADTPPTVGEIGQHFPEIAADGERTLVPKWNREEYEDVVERLGR
jgi:NAD(P)-dependent dehydrogenase (short-subunit alcohol dehydrogenase family)